MLSVVGTVRHAKRQTQFGVWGRKWKNSHRVTWWTVDLICAFF